MVLFEMGGMMRNPLRPGINVQRSLIFVFVLTWMTGCLGRGHIADYSWTLSHGDLPEQSDDSDVYMVNLGEGFLMIQPSGKANTPARYIATDAEGDVIWVSHHSCPDFRTLPVLRSN